MGLRLGLGFQGPAVLIHRIVHMGDLSLGRLCTWEGVGVGVRVKVRVRIGVRVRARVRVRVRG